MLRLTGSEKETCYGGCDRNRCFHKDVLRQNPSLVNRQPARAGRFVHESGVFHGRER